MALRQLASPAWGNKPVNIYQEHGAYNSDHPDWYAYAEGLGMAYGTHPGLDIGVELGTPIYALNSGVVDFAGFDNSFRPYYVKVKTSDDPDTKENESDYIEVYGHLNKALVETGQKIKPGKQLGLSGEQTERGTTDVPDKSGPHLHFELRQPGANTTSGYKAIEPTKWLQKKGIVLDPSDDSEGGSSPEPEKDEGTGSVLPDFQQLGQRTILIVVGLGILLIGAFSAFSGGFGAAAGKAVPALKLAKAVKRASTG